jgi:2,5-dihydroxypyridine 5,6-dioxygenase
MLWGNVGPELARAAHILACDMMSVKASESVLISADTSTDLRLVEAVQNACCAMEAKVATVVLAPPVRFQGTLADAYLPDHFKAAAVACDVWIDFCFPYLAGSKTYDTAVHNQRTRYFLGADIGSGGLTRLMGRGHLDQIFALSDAFAELVEASAGKVCHVTNRVGSDVGFTLAKTEGLALAKATRPGGYFVPGTVLLIPELESVRGVIRCDAAFHEYYSAMRDPLSIEIDGTVKRVSGGGPDQALMERALLRAGGNKSGYVVHFSCGIHPVARFTGASFIEDQRVVGYNAVGLGLPPWMPGGGENHPDAIMSLQTIEIDQQAIVKDGRIVAPPELVELESVLNAELA